MINDPQLLVQSKLVPAAFLTPQRMEALSDAALSAALAKAKADMKGVMFTARAMLPSDLGETNEIWADQTGGSGNARENSIIAAQAVADDTWVGIYGLIDTSAAQYISYIEWSIGSGVRARWSVFDYWSEDTRIEARTAYALNPIVITKSIAATIVYYIMGAAGTSQSTHIAYLGWVVEKAGTIINPA